MPDRDDGRQPDESAEGIFAELNRKTSALDRLQAETDDRLAELQRRQADMDAQVADTKRHQEVLTRKLDRWNQDFAELMDELVRRLTSTAEQLLRLDGTLGEIAERHPDSRTDLTALRADLRAETRRLSDHTDLMKQLAYRVYGLERPGRPKPAAPLIPYDRALSRRLTNLMYATLGAGGLLGLSTLLPIPGPSAPIIEHFARGLAAFACGVAVVHIMLRRRARAYERTRRA